MSDRAVRSAVQPYSSAVGGPVELPADYIEMMHADGHHNPPAFLHATANLFRGIELRGRRVLEIGSGKGLMALYAGLHGAAEVVSLEPELVGATSGVVALQRKRVAKLGLRNVTVVPADFNTWDSGEARFDVILSRASINHLYPSERHALRDRETMDGYVGVARRIRGMLKESGVLVATDACRYALFTGLRGIGLRRPWRWQRTGVDWRHHQNPSTWAVIFKRAGFDRTGIRYPVPYSLRYFTPVVDTAVANFLLEGKFILHASVESPKRAGAVRR
jgi:SAM-dependent methyltransferase